MKRSIPQLALEAVGLGVRGDGDNDPTLSAIDTLLVDVEILRYTLANCEGEEESIVPLAANAVDRFLDRLSIIRGLHKGQSGALEVAAVQ